MIATALALAAVEPWNSGLGGIGHAVVHRAGEPRAETVDFGPTAPAGLDPSRFKLTGKVAADLFGWPEAGGDANIHGPLSFVIPSAVAGYAEMHRRWGKLPLAEIAAPAIALAKRGLPQDWYTTLKVANSAAILRRCPESARIYLRDGLPPLAPYQGALSYFPLGRLCETLERLAQTGWRDFYQGGIAADIAADVERMDGVLSANDLHGCKARVLPAAEVPWRGRTLQLAGPLTAAPTAADALRQLAGARFGSAGRRMVRRARGLAQSRLRAMPDVARRCGACRRRKLHHPHHGVRCRGHDDRADHDAPLLAGGNPPTARFW